MLLSKTVTSEVCFCSFSGEGDFFKKGLHPIREGGRSDWCYGYMDKKKESADGVRTCVFVCVHASACVQ